VLDPEVAEVGKELTVLWGEPDGGSSKPVVERHKQIEIRARVTDCPIAPDAREHYKKWAA
jgi:hypothetical protein